MLHNLSIPCERCTKHCKVFRLSFFVTLRLPKITIGVLSEPVLDNPSMITVSDIMEVTLHHGSRTVWDLHPIPYTIFNVT